MSYDLHVHTKHSNESKVDSEKIVANAVKKGLEGIAITDHDTTEGIEEIKNIAKQTSLEIIAGIEIDFKYIGVFGGKEYYLEGEMLGYFIDSAYEKFMELKKSSEASREKNNIEIIEKLRNAGYDIDVERVQKMAGPRKFFKGDICRFMIKNEQVKASKDGSLEPAYALIGEGRPYHVKRDKWNIEKAAKEIIESGGVPVLAHGGIMLSKYGIDLDIFTKNIVPLLIELGVVSCEIYPYDIVGKGFDKEQTEKWNQFFSEQNRLFFDIDGVKGGDSHFADRLGIFTANKEVVEQLRKKSR